MSIAPIEQPVGLISTATDCATRRSDVLAILLLGTVLFAFNPPPEFLGMDARFAVFTQHMLRDGPTFFPVSHLGPYPDYPATTILPIYALSLLFGKVTPLACVLPSAMVSAGILAVIYRIGATRSRHWGLYAVCFAALTFTFVQSARSYPSISTPASSPPPASTSPIPRRWCDILRCRNPWCENPWCENPFSHPPPWEFLPAIRPSPTGVST